jgi:hypothetical protein
MNTIQSINGTSLPRAPQSPNGYSVTTSDLDSDSSGRSAETGKLIRYTIRKGIYKIALSFRGPAADIRAIRDIIAPNSLTVVFWDIDRWQTATMYVSDRSTKLLPVPGQSGWFDLSFNLIEY